MGRPKKDNRPLSARIDTKIHDRLDDYCERSGQSKTIAVERAISMYIDDYDKKMEKLKEY